MAFKGTAAKSSSGASMSKYDVEVEARLKKLEAAVAALEKHTHSGGGSDNSRLDEVIGVLKSQFPKNKPLQNL
tara:strand:+ start:119 stop:337 length:219 start_codon:yes stop_codon:yes gene_type:complete